MCLIPVAPPAVSDRYESIYIRNTAWVSTFKGILSLCQEQRLRASTIKVMLRHRGWNVPLLLIHGCRLCTA